MVDNAPLEKAAEELIAAFSIVAPPIPIESILQHPQADMWEELDLSQLSSTFFTITATYSPRMSMARFLARQIVNSEWGVKHGIGDIARDDARLYAFARMLVMPASMINELNPESRTPELISAHFESPEEDARLRLIDMKIIKS